MSANKGSESLQFNIPSYLFMGFVLLEMESRDRGQKNANCHGFDILGLLVDEG